MSAEPTAQLFIGRLSSAATASELERTFCKFGELVRCEVKRGTNMCYAFVEYSSPDHAAEALRKCNGMPVCGEDIVVQFARAAARKRDNNNCFRCGREGAFARESPRMPAWLGQAA
ncbi:hypothetical protein LPJ61_003689 [Coemansia biformis]|uniref:RRM domain-containing protein n=1 Tax=Coemansia biformis TaxID=1286918 RepID=A0A9W7YAR4_9FUNG|nr:hypothetical protein LPJ61_003689 [Coemansia biformis]